MAHITYRDGIPTLNNPWSADDIRQTAEGMDNPPDLTDVEVEQVMLLVVKTHDCNIGINWDVIKSAIDVVLKNTRGS